MRIVYVDIEEPVLNIYDAGEQDPPWEVGEIVDFGTSRESSMWGSWRVLSHERFYNGGEPGALRCNIIRHEPSLRAELKQWSGKFVVSGMLTAETQGYMVSELVEMFERARL